MNGEVGLSNELKEMRVSYRGDVAIGSVKMLDKVTNDRFSALELVQREWDQFQHGIRGAENPCRGAGPEQLLRTHHSQCRWPTESARRDRESRGSADLIDRAHGAPGATGAVPTPALTPAPTPTPTPTPGATSEAAASPAAAPSPAPLPADVEVGRITLSGGQVNYSDNFIKPNYSADLTQMNGKVGTFGTDTTTPAES